MFTFEQIQEIQKTILPKQEEIFLHLEEHRPHFENTIKYKNPSKAYHSISWWINKRIFDLSVDPYLLYGYLKLYLPDLFPK